MFTLSRQQVRLFRLHAHHLDTWYSLQDALLTAFLDELDTLLQHHQH